MKIKLTDTSTSWVKIVDEDISKLSDSQLYEVMDLVLNNTLVVFKNQKLHTDEQTRICNVFGNLQDVLSPDHPREDQRTGNIAVNQNILRVTGKKNSNGEPGLFGHTNTLDWHANQASNYERKPIVWLYGVHGTRGSRTSWINNILSYDELSPEFKVEIQDLEITLGYKQNSYTPSDFFIEHHSVDKPFKLVHTNDANKTGLYFPFLQIFGMKDKDQTYFNKTTQRLRYHVLQSQYRYDHDWEDGDIVLSEQWLGIHKRWEFKNMEDRLLHRITFDYTTYLENTGN